MEIGWISVNDAMPDWGVPVLTFQPSPRPESYRMNVAALRKGHGGKPFWSMAAVDEGVTHWIPLPVEPA